MAQRGTYDAFQFALAKPEPPIAGDSTIPGYMVAIVTRSRGRVEVQIQQLYLLGDRFVKVRSTLPADGWEKSHAPLFARALAAEVRRR